MTACIVGWAHSPFGKLNGETVESLIARVAGDALADAAISAKDVDEIVLGHFNAGFSAQDFTASLVLQASPDLRFKRATRVENACATGSAAVHQGLKAIAAGAARIVPSRRAWSSGRGPQVCGRLVQHCAGAVGKRRWSAPWLAALLWKARATAKRFCPPWRSTSPPPRKCSSAERKTASTFPSKS